MTLRVIPSTRQGHPAQTLLGGQPLTLMGFSYKAREARGHLPGSPLPAGPRIPDLPGEPAPSHSHSSGHAVTPSAVTDTGLRKGRGSL